jgi:selenocysteine lyase/cysteine desulfurase
LSNDSPADTREIVTPLGLNESFHEGHVTLDEAKASFPETHKYLAACTVGLPPRATVTAMTADLAAWSRGEDPARYDEALGAARQSYAQLVHVPTDCVSVGSQSSVLAALIASSVPSGAEVICVKGDFSSMVFPFLQQAHRNVSVRSVPLEDIAASITEKTWLVAFSIVQSATGAIADTESIRLAAQKHGTYTLCDTTQAVGWLPINASAFDATICHSYKWLCSPRGAAFLTILPEFADRVHPTQAGWYAAENPWTSCYGPHMHLAEDARRFDVSPAWPVWIGAAVSLKLFASLDIEKVRQHNTQLGNDLCAAMGLPSKDQAIITWDDPHGSDLVRLSENGIIASGRAGRVRVAFHLWNNQSDVEAVLRAIAR